MIAGSYTGRRSADLGDEAALARHATYYDEYFNNEVPPERLDSMRAGDIEFVRSVPTRETLFVADPVIEDHRFARIDGQYWLITNPKKESVNEYEDYSIELGYGFGKKLGVGFAEQRVVSWHGQKLIASRFLENGIDGDGLKEVPQALKTRVENELTRALPFNVLLALGGDLQYVFTTDGQIMMIDQSCSRLLAEQNYDTVLHELQLGEYLFPRTDAGRGNLVDHLPMIDAIEALTDAEIYTLVKHIPQNAKQGRTTITDYRDQITSAIKWRRDNIRSLFTAYFSESSPSP